MIETLIHIVNGIVLFLGFGFIINKVFFGDKPSENEQWKNLRIYEEWINLEELDRNAQHRKAEK